MVLYLENSVSFELVFFSTEQLYCSCKNNFIVLVESFLACFWHF